MQSTYSLRLYKIIFLILFLTTAIGVSQTKESQNSKEAIMNSVYSDVWLPFMESYRELDLEKFKSIQAKELIRVSIDKNTINSKDEYFKEMGAFFNQIKGSKRVMDIRFAILSAATGNDTVYQTGYYSISIKGSNSESYQPMGYGYFTVVIIKENGAWKISLDADKNAAIGEEEFRKSEVLYDLSLNK